MKVFKKVITSLLGWEARLILKKYRPRIIAVTGSVGKTSAKDAIYQILSSHFFTVKSTKSYNSELGLPLTITGCPNAWSNPIGWLKNLLEGLTLLIWRNHYPQWLVLEVGVDRPGDIGRLTGWLKPEIVVLTSLPDYPAHVEFFESATTLADEKLRLVEIIKPNGWLIINYDDSRLRQLKTKLEQQLANKQVKVISYGFDSTADLAASHDRVIYQSVAEQTIPVAWQAKINYRDDSLPLRLNGIFGRQQAYAPLAALAVGWVLKLNFLNLTADLEDYQLPPGRGRLIKGVKESWLIDESYNSSPVALEAALATLGSLVVTGRKIAVIGDMLELGEHTIKAHQQAGVAATEVLDYLITVGPRAKFTFVAAEKKRFGKKKMKHFDDASEVGPFLQNLIKLGDIILIKGSQALRLEKVVEEVMADPSQKSSLLARQEKEWQER